MSKETFTCSNQ